jgi:hypothetical protein
MTNRTTLILIAVAALAPQLAQAQSLRGSPASVDRMYYKAQAQGLTFFKSAEQVADAADAGKVVLLRGNMDYAVVGTRVPYVRPETLRFIEALGAAHRQACGEPIIVTSGIRPTERRLRNSHVKTVHPTGMAVDIRKSPGNCRVWLRKALLGLESQGLIEAIEENRPPHFHIAVYSAPASSRILAAANSSAGSRSARRGSGSRGRD